MRSTSEDNVALRRPFRFLTVMAFWAAVLAAPLAEANSTGITGRTNLSGGAGCGSCHSFSQTLGVSISGPTTLSIVSGTTNYSINVSGGAAFNNIGIDVAANGGTLGEAVANLYVSGGEVTHTPTLNTAGAGGTGGYTFNFTLPGNASASSASAGKHR